MSDAWDHDERKLEVARALEEIGAQDLDLETWDGEDLDALQEFLDDEQYEALLDCLGLDGLET